jgi:hypothetical protein
LRSRDVTQFSLIWTADDYDASKRARSIFSNIIMQMTRLLINFLSSR